MSQPERMIFDMQIVLVSLALACLPAVLSAWCAYKFATRQSAQTEVRGRRLLAATDLSQPLRDLQMLLRRRGRVPVSQAEVSSAISRLETAWDRHKHRLPDDLRHARRSVLDAVGTAFGAVAMTHISPDLADYPLAEPDFRWQEYADEYLEYVLDALVRWGDSERPRKVFHYDSWLIKTGRRDPLGLDGSR